MEDVGRVPTDLAPVNLQPTTTQDLDAWIESLMNCKQLAEVDVQRLCEKVCLPLPSRRPCAVAAPAAFFPAPPPPPLPTPRLSRPLPRLSPANLQPRVPARRAAGRWVVACAPKSPVHMLNCSPAPGTRGVARRVQRTTRRTFAPPPPAVAWRRGVVAATDMAPVPPLSATLANAPRNVP